MLCAALTINRNNNLFIFLQRLICKFNIKTIVFYSNSQYAAAKDTASAFGKVVSQFLNWASGGTKYTPGHASPTFD